jgi:hypothetical protein
VSDRGALGVLAALIVAAFAATWHVRIPQFWGDAATYHAMAWSLAYDGDVEYEAKDIYRVRREFSSGPQGIFLKRTTGGLVWDKAAGFPFLHRPEKARIVYAKPLLHGLLAAPLVRLFDTRGLFLLNAFAWAASLLLGYAIGRRLGRSPTEALVLTVSLLAGTITPIYLGWIAPEMLYVALAAAALAAWCYERPLLAAALLGVAAYAKPPNVLLAIPLLAAPLVTDDDAVVPRVIESMRRGAVLVAAALLFVGLNVALTGEANYQGGERKTFHPRVDRGEAFPFERNAEGKDVTFGNSGVWMTTPLGGPQAEGDDAPPPTPRTEPPRPASELRVSFFRNLRDFWIGRFGGALPYFLPVVVALLFFGVEALRHRATARALAATALAWLLALALIPERWYGGGHFVNLLLLAAFVLPVLAFAGVASLGGPRDRDGALALTALVATFVFYIWLIPDNWYGGSGTLGNRYFLPLVPLALFFAPRGRERLLGLSALASVGIFLWPLFVAPLYHSLHPAAHGTRAAFRALPPELAMLNDLAVFTEPWHKKQPYGDTGDEHKHWPAEPTAYYLYFSDDGTFGRESLGDVPGFWMRGGVPAEVVLRAFDRKPIRRMRIAVTGGPAGDDVSIGAEGRRESLVVAPGEKKEVVFDATPGFAYKETLLHVLHFRSHRGGIDSMGRTVGAFVHITLEVDGKR